MIKIGQKMDHRRCYGLRGVVVLKKGLIESGTQHKLESVCVKKNWYSKYTSIIMNNAGVLPDKVVHIFWFCYSPFASKWHIIIRFLLYRIRILYYITFLWSQNIYNNKGNAHEYLNSPHLFVCLGSFSFIHCIISATKM